MLSDEFSVDVIILLFEKRYMIIFQIIDEPVYADYVVDCRQDYRWLIH